MTMTRAEARRARARWALLAAAMGAAFAAGTAQAGKHGDPSPPAVSLSIGTSSITASGSMGGTRASSSNNELVEIEVDAWWNGATVVQAIFTDQNGTSKECVSNNPAVVDALQNAANDSQVWARWNIVAGSDTPACDSVVVKNSSQYAPKMP